MLNRYILLNGCAFLASTYATTIGAGFMAESLIKNRDMTLLYLGRDIPGQIIGLGISVLLTLRLKSNPYRIGLMSSSLLPLSTTIDVFSPLIGDDNIMKYVVFSGALRTISFVGPAAAHNASIVKAISCYKEAGTFGVKNAVVTSGLATLGASIALVCMKGIEDDEYKRYLGIMVSMLYPLALSMSWKIMKI
jgi:hypothetical protein